jgi:hypothetical protein
MPLHNIAASNMMLKTIMKTMRCIRCAEAHTQKTAGCKTMHTYAEALHVCFVSDMSGLQHRDNLLSSSIDQCALDLVRHTDVSV